MALASFTLVLQYNEDNFLNKPCYFYNHVAFLHNPAATPSPRSGSAAFGLLQQSVLLFQRISEVGFQANGQTGACGVEWTMEDVTLPPSSRGASTQHVSKIMKPS